MAIVAGIYYWRARTEERHLRADPAYEEYYQWMERNGLVPRFFQWVSGKSKAVTPDRA
jgi:protein-S-isoprenylcysteine O-methyltransferase Ste14